MNAMNPLVLVLSTTTALGAGAQDWPTYRADNARSGVTRTELHLPLELLWEHRAVHAPRPAWPGPARRDAYNEVENLHPRLAFDRAFHLAVADGRLYYGSSADDQVRCLDVATGAELWTFFAEAPVRFAPTWDAGRVYFGSDDGHVYCVDGRTGQLIWRHRPAPRDARVPGNGRMMSVWPVRTGVVVVDGTAYAGAGLFPSEGAFLCALRTRDGSPLWSRALEQIHPEGYMLASRESLYVPSGRGRPFVFARGDGEKLRELGGGGGSFALLAGDSLIYGPGKSGQLGEFEGAKDHVATFDGDNLIVAGGMAYLNAGRRLSALARTRYLELSARKRALAKERKELAKRTEPDGQRSSRRRTEEIGREIERIEEQLPECTVWSRACAPAFEMILAGAALIVGSDGNVAAVDTGDGREIWRAACGGAARGLAAARGRLYVSTDLGHILCFGAAR